MKEKVKCYIYTRVSTAMQIDGYSLEAQKTKMKDFCDYNEYEIVGEYEDTWKSGKVLHNTCEARKDDLGKRLHFFICRQQIRDHDRVQASGMCCTDSIV